MREEEGRAPEVGMARTLPPRTGGKGRSEHFPGILRSVGGGEELEAVTLIDQGLTHGRGPTAAAQVWVPSIAEHRFTSSSLELRKGDAFLD